MSVPPEDVVPPPPPPAAPPPSDPPPSEPPVAGGPSAEQRQWAMFAHLSALLGLVTAGWACFLGPLVIWLVKKDTMPFVDDQAKEALNFNITVMIAGAICWILVFVLIGFLLLWALAIVWIVFTIIAAIKANEGVAYRYPFALRLIK
ncbi:DUF4870 domain-containing protein [Dyella thiooxydans]|uniref:DUF4870 domain-containing protein n=1 Tax=Dyella thiooxydans TaxID=445710 RepID=UPI0007C5B6F8|nr:DUF4870 domain-containing protein [Dyella thiooxydans]